MKSRFNTGAAFLIGALVVFLLVYSNSLFGFLELSPSQKQSEFVSACSGLNNKELTATNINSLGGWCSLDGTFHQCGGENIERLKNKTDPFFVIYHMKQYDVTWVCTIAEELGKIKANASYRYD